MFVARLAIPMAAYRWQRKSGEDNVGTSGRSAPAATMAAVCEYSADKLPIALTASLCTSTDLDRRTYFRCCNNPVSIIGPWFSKASAKFARTPHDWCAISTSNEWANLMRTSMPPSLTIEILFCSDNERLRNAAASSLWTSMESESAKASKGCRPFISTNWKRHFGVKLNCLTAKQACKCVSWSLSLIRATNGRSTPILSKTRWFFSLDATLFNPKAVHRLVSRSSQTASGSNEAIAPLSKSSW
mmetsp:Transcript_15586/g.41000  ORF Transcript_15586/g.41000 Transcript_15586/m.41000 type:complete len:244 (+) Transcript_15586:302-1033(+)